MIMTILEAFEKFRIERRLTKDKPTNAILKDIKDKGYGSKDVINAITNLDDYIKGLKNVKVNAAKRYLEFLKWLENQGYKGLDTEISGDHLYADPTIRRLALIKYMHDGHSRTKIQDEFLISETTLKDDINAIEDGIEVLETSLRVKSREHRNEDNVTYDDDNNMCSCHPIFLALNTTELYFLLKVLPKCIQGEQTKEILNKILANIYPQLSGYALKKLDIPCNDYRIKTKPVFNFEYKKVKEDIAYAIMYLQKSGRLAILKYLDENDEIKTICGTLDCLSGNAREVLVIVEPNKERVYIPFEKIEEIVNLKEIYQ